VLHGFELPRRSSSGIRVVDDVFVDGPPSRQRILARATNCCAVVPARTRRRNRCRWERFISIRSGLVIDMAGILRVGSLISAFSLTGHTHPYWVLTRRSATMTHMAARPASTKTSLQQRLSARARAQWPQLAGVTVRFRGAFAYVQGELPDGDTLPLMRLRYGGSTARWGFAMYLASKDGYEDVVLPTGAFAGLPENALDYAAGLYLGDPTL
jgi:hypothetical protein